MPQIFFFHLMGTLSIIQTFVNVNALNVNETIIETLQTKRVPWRRYTCTVRIMWRKCEEWSNKRVWKAAARTQLPRIPRSHATQRSVFMTPLTSWVMPHNARLVNYVFIRSVLVLNAYQHGCHMLNLEKERNAFNGVFLDFSNTFNCTAMASVIRKIHC